LKRPHGLTLNPIMGWDSLTILLSLPLSLFVQFLI
jgi:hypothetical protein